VTDQLEHETDREELVKKGKKSPEEADQENDEWEQVRFIQNTTTRTTKVFFVALTAI